MVVVNTTTRAQNRFAAALVAKVQTPVTQVGQALAYRAFGSVKNHQRRDVSLFQTNA